MKQIEYFLQASDKWIREIHQSLPSELSENTLQLHPDFGKGSIQVIEIQRGLFITFISVQSNSSMLFRRLAGIANNHFIINFHFSKMEISREINGKKYALGFNNNSILLASATTASEAKIPPNLPIDIFNITFSKEWLLKNGIGEQDYFLKQMLNHNQPVYLFENLDYTFEKTIQQIKKSRAKTNKIGLFADVLQVLSHFFTKIQNRKYEELQAINPQDLGSLMAVRQNIEQDWTNVKSNETLAKAANMSLSKFKRLFKQVFGTSPYQYHLKYKMERAMELLQKKEFSVSEVGAYIGYSNLSQFSKAFKKHHHILPKDLK